MRGPIDYIIVGFEGNKFEGNILKEIGSAIESGVIDLIALAIIRKDSHGIVKTLNLENLGDEFIINFTQKYPTDNKLLSEEDVSEVGSVLEKDTSAGLLIIEQLWAKPLKKALLDANGVLVAEGRIHPEAEEELNLEKEKNYAGIA
jgi:hypothetical protein